MFERGFKTWCEKYATSKREEMGLASSDRLDAKGLAANLGIAVWTPHDIQGLSTEALAILLRNDGRTPSCWSAVTLVAGGKTVVILNSSHSRGRQASDLTHELAHRIRGHQTHEMENSHDGLMLLSAYDKEQEDEADWLSSCLLLPRDALVHISRVGQDLQVAAEHYCVSVKMLKYRMAMTGVDRQFGRVRA